MTSPKSRGMIIIYPAVPLSVANLECTYRLLGVWEQLAYIYYSDSLQITHVYTSKSFCIPAKAMILSVSPFLIGWPTTRACSDVMATSLKRHKERKQAIPPLLLKESGVRYYVNFFSGLIPKQHPIHIMAMFM